MLEPQEEFSQIGRIMFIAAWIIGFILLFLFFYYYQGNEKTAYTQKNGELIIPADNNGHYQLSGFINEVPVRFIVDTGATTVAIPQVVADKLRIQGNYPINIRTANGEITGSLTRVESISFGNFVLHNVKAVIIPNKTDEDVLLGMNVLANFSILQEDKRLIIKSVPNK